MKACRANLSPVFGLYPDEHTHAAAALDEAVAGVAGLVCEDDLGVRHTLWPVTNVNAIGEVTTAMASNRCSSPMVVRRPYCDRIGLVQP